MVAPTEPWSPSASNVTCIGGVEAFRACAPAGIEVIDPAMTLTTTATSVMAPVLLMAFLLMPFLLLVTGGAPFSRRSGIEDGPPLSRRWEKSLHRPWVRRLIRSSRCGVRDRRGLPFARAVLANTFQCEQENARCSDHQDDCERRTPIPRRLRWLG